MLTQVTVLMPVYNAEKYLKKCIESIINQSFKDFILLIINDGSNDNSLNIINSFKDSRIIVINNEINKGLIYSLNKGIKFICTKYIIRMDSDDICLKDRIEKQYNFMENNPDIAVSGGQAIVFLSYLPFIMRKSKAPLKYREIKSWLLFNSPIIHPSVIMRRSTINENNYRYNIKFKGMEDFDLWQRIGIHNRIENLDVILIKYRLSKNCVTAKANKNIGERKELFKILIKRSLDLFGIKYTKDEVDIHMEICLVSNLRNLKKTLKNKEEWLLKLLEFNKKKQLFERNTFQTVLAKNFYKTCLYHNNFKGYIQSEFNMYFKRNNFNYLIDKFQIYIIQFVKRCGIN